jgi:hypothetical protein
MQRRFVTILLVLLSFWQAASATSLALFSLEQNAELSHLTLHWQGIGHHHENDGSVHTDDSLDSAQHTMVDCGMHYLGIVASSQAVAIELTTQRFIEAAQRHPLSPYLDGLRRPPKALI